MVENSVVYSIRRILDLFEGGGFGFGKCCYFNMIFSDFHFQGLERMVCKVFAIFTEGEPIG